MKVKKINSNSKKTEDLIKESFVILLNEKRKLELITVTELVKKANITRSSFYTHYENIYEVAKAIQDDTISLFLNDKVEFHSIDDVNNYIDKIINYLKENEQTYKMLLSSYDTILFFDKIRDAFVKDIYELFIKSGIEFKNIKLDIEFFLDGMLLQIIKYFRNNSNYSIDDIGARVKIWFKEIFITK